MTTQKRVQKAKGGKAEEAEATPPEEVRASPEAEALKAHTDDLLDEIDSLLEENAAQFVREYVQRGGQ